MPYTKRWTAMHREHTRLCHQRVLEVKHHAQCERTFCVQLRDKLKLWGSG